QVKAVERINIRSEPVEPVAGAALGESPLILICQSPEQTAPQISQQAQDRIVVVEPFHVSRNGTTQGKKANSATRYVDIKARRDACSESHAGQGTGGNEPA